MNYPPISSSAYPKPPSALPQFTMNKCRYPASGLYTGGVKRDNMNASSLRKGAAASMILIQSRPYSANVMFDVLPANDMRWAKLLKAVAGGRVLLSVTWKRKAEHPPDKCPGGNPTVIKGWLDVEWFRIISSQKVSAVCVRFSTKGPEVQGVRAWWEEISYKVPTEVEEAGRQDTVEL